MKGPFEDLLSFLVSLSPSRITFNLNVSTVYAEGLKAEGLDVINVWNTLKLESGEEVECCGKSYDGTRVKGSFYPGVSVHLKRPLSWYRGTVEAFAVLYDVGDVVVVEGRKRKAYRGSFRERGQLNLYNWRYVDLPGGGMFYLPVPRGTRRFALLPSSFVRLNFPTGYNVLIRIYETLGDWKTAVMNAVRNRGVNVKSPGARAFRVGKYLVKVVGDDLLIVHERRAIFRVLYERFLQEDMRTRRLLMPLNVGDVEPERAAALRRAGFRIRDGNVVEVPEFLKVIDPATLSSLLEDITGTEKREVLARKVARVLSKTTTMEPEDLIISLMMCNNPYQDPDGNVIVRRITLEDLNELLP